MSRILRYELTEHPECSVRVPQGAKFLRVNSNKKGVSAWYVVSDLYAPDVTQDFRIVSTSEEFDGGAYEYLGTWEESGGLLVWHLLRVV